MLNIFAFYEIALASLNFFKQLEGICTGNMNPNWLKTVVCIVFMGLVAVKYNRVAFVCGYVFSVLDICKAAVKDMSYQKAVVIFTH